MDDENLNNGEQRTSDLDQSMQQTTNAMKTGANAVGKGAKKVEETGKKLYGKKQKNTYFARKMQAVANEAKAGVKKKIRGATTWGAGTGMVAAGGLTKGTGALLSALGKKITAGSAGFAAPVGEALDAAGQSMKTTGEKISQGGKKIQKHGTNTLNRGTQQIRNAKFAEPGQSSGDDGDGQMPKLDNINMPNPKNLLKKTLKQAKELLKKFAAEYLKKVLLIAFLIGIVVAIVFFVILFITGSKENSGKYVEGDNSNVPYVINSMVMNQITIVEDGKGGYMYAFEDSEGNILSLDEVIDDVLAKLEANGGKGDLKYLGNTKEEQKELLKKMIQAEVSTQYPDLGGSGSRRSRRGSGNTVINDDPGPHEGSYTFGDGSTWEYYLYVPEVVDESKPLVVYQCGNGKQGLSLEAAFTGAYSSDHGWTYLAKNQGATFDYYVLEVHSRASWFQGDVPKLKELTESIVEEHDIDPGRISLWGFSMGAERIEWNIHEYPDFYSSVVILGRNTSYIQAPASYSDFSGIPTCFSCDSADSYSSYGTPTLYQNFLNNGLEAELFETSTGLGHYETLTRAIQNEELIDWMLGTGSDVESTESNDEKENENQNQQENNDSQNENNTEVNNDNNSNDENDTNIDNNSNATNETKSTQSEEDKTLSQWGWLIQNENIAAYYYRKGIGNISYEAVKNYITEDGKNYIVVSNGTGTYFGQGVQVYSSEYNNYNTYNLDILRDNGVNVKEPQPGDLIDAEAADATSQQIFMNIKEQIQAVSDEKGLNLTEEQVVALVDVSYLCGNANAQLAKIQEVGADSDEIANMPCFEYCERDASPANRAQLVYKLFKYGIYDTYGIYNPEDFGGAIETSKSSVYNGDKLVGGIKIQRKNENGGTQKLKYVPEDEFNKLVSSNSNSAMRYFTLKKTSKNKENKNGSTSASTGALFTFVASWENGPALRYAHGFGSINNRLVSGYVTEDGKSYICRTDEGMNNGTKNFGFGVMVNQNGVPNNVEYFAEYGIDITDPQYLQEHVSTLPTDIVDAISQKILDDKMEYLDKLCTDNDVTLTTEQKHALADAMYQHGDGGANLSQFFALYKQYGNSEELRDRYTTPNGKYHIFLSVPGGGGVDGKGRGLARWALFHDGEYHYGDVIEWDVEEGSSSSGSSSSGVSTSGSSSNSSYKNNGAGKVDSNGVTLTENGNLEFLEAAIAAHKYSREHKLPWSGAGRDVLPTPDTPSNYTYMDCSTMVSFALEWYGNTDWHGYSWLESTGNYHELTPGTLEKFGDEKLETVYKGTTIYPSSIPDLQSGDIIMMPGHTQIFYGYNSSGVPVWLNAGSTNSICNVTEGADAYGTMWEPITKVFRVPGGGSSSKKKVVDSLDNFLFIGDSRYSTINSQILALGENINNQGAGSSRIDEWLKVANAGGRGIVQQGTRNEKNVDITGTYQGISVQLGANSMFSGGGAEGAADQMKELLQQIKKLHPGTPIFVNSCLSVNDNATRSGYAWNVTEMKDRMKQFDKEISAFCDQNEDLYFIDISEGLEDVSGFVKLEYEGDGLHLSNSEGIDKFLQNLKNGILNAGASTGLDTSDSNVSKNSCYALVVANSKDTNVTVMRSYAYQGSYEINRNSGVTNSNVGNASNKPADSMVSSKSTSTVSSTTVDYQEALNRYTLYFDFLWAILVDSSDKELVSDWADLALNGNVVITAYNDTHESVTTNEVPIGTQALTSGNGTIVHHDIYQVNERTTTKVKTITSKCAITKANTWIVDYQNDAKDYKEYRAKTEEKMVEKTDPNASETNIIQILQSDKKKLYELNKEEYLVDRMLENNTKVNFMIDMYSYLLKVANEETNIKTTLQGIGLLDTSAFDLSNSSNIVAKKAIVYKSLNLTDSDKEMLYKAVETICDPYGDDEANTTRKKYVASVILNRVMSEEFPNSVKKVLKQRKEFPNFKYSKLNDDVVVLNSTRDAVNEVIEKGDCSQRSTYMSDINDKWEGQYTEIELNDAVFRFYTKDYIDEELKKYEVIVGYGRAGRRGNYEEGWTPEEDMYNTGMSGVYNNGDRTFNVYIQDTNSLWAKIRYSQQDFHSSACGATSVAIVASAIDSSITPIESGKAIYESVGATFGTNVGGGVVTNTGALSSALNKFGIKHEWRYGGVSDDEVRAHLEQGLPIIVLLANDRVGDKSYGGHYLTVLGMNDQGEMFVGDPAYYGTLNSGYHDEKKVLPLSDNTICLIYYD